MLDKTRQTLKVDITTGDYVTPKEIAYSFSLMFEDREISILAYNLETVLAEKFETIITRSTATTRMRDFYDIYILTTTQVFSPEVFKDALKKTMEKRGTAAQMLDCKNTMEAIASSPIMKDLWERYQKKFTYAADLPWEVVVSTLEKLSYHAMA